MRGDWLVCLLVGKINSYHQNLKLYEQQWSQRSGLCGKESLMMRLMIWTAGECGFRYLAPLMVTRYLGQRWCLPGRRTLMEKWKGTRPGWSSRIQTEEGGGQAGETMQKFNEGENVKRLV
ncbi:unnamed protein product, partial [Choristocarpus tenellus]